MLEFNGLMNIKGTTSMPNLNIQVIPAKAGIQEPATVQLNFWIPAFAGMTKEKLSRFLPSGFSSNNRLSVITKYTQVNRWLINILLLAVCVLAVFPAFDRSAWAGNPAGDSGEKGFVFVVLGDNRPYALFAPQPEVFHGIITRINTFLPDFVVSTGDCVYGHTMFPLSSQRQYQAFQEALDPLKVPIYICPGNHDVSGEQGMKYFKKYVGKPYFSFWHKGSVFILLNTEEPDAGGNIPEKQLKWLKKRLKKAKKRGAGHIFVFLHRPLFMPELSSRRKRRQPPSDRDLLHRLFVEYKVDMVFAGHEHYYNRQVVDDVVYIISAGAGAPLYAAPEEGGFHHLIKVRVHGDEVMDEVVRIEPSS